MKWFSEHENGSKHDRDCAWRAQETIRKDNDRNEHKLALIAAADRRKKLREEEKAKEKEKAKIDKDKGKGKKDTDETQYYSVVQREKV